MPRGYISSPRCTEDFQTCLNLLTQRGLAICSCLNSLEGEKNFLWCLNLPRVTSPLPLDALRTCNLASICLCKEVLQSILAYTRSRRGGPFNLFSPTLAHGEEDLLISSRLHSLTARRSFQSLHAYTRSRRGGPFNLFSPMLAHGEEDLLISSRLHSLTARMTFLISSRLMVIRTDPAC